MSRFTVIIPARQASTRLPGKMLADLAGKPMVVRVAEQALASAASRVFIATDHPDIAQAGATHGIETIITRADHPSGTDRLAEACAILGLDDQDIIVNVQGDEPLMDPALINEVAQALISDSGAAIATCAAPIADADHLFNPNVVKAVARRDGRAMYFSRAPIPWARDALAGGQKVLAPGVVALHHIGMYAYRAGFLRVFPTLTPGTLEQIESLEQLRALEHGYQIALKTIAHHPGTGVDTEDDLLRVRSIFEKMQQKNSLER